MRSADFTKVLAGIVAAGSILLSQPLSAQELARNDLVIPLDPFSFVSIAFDGEPPGPVSVEDGIVQLEAEDADCIASPDNPCNYIVRAVQIYLSDFPVPTNQGTFNIRDPFIIITGPIAVTDFGGGFQIPAGTIANSGGFIDGPGIAALQDTDQPIPSPINITLDVLARRIHCRRVNLVGRAPWLWGSYVQRPWREPFADRDLPAWPVSVRSSRQCDRAAGSAAFRRRRWRRCIHLHVGSRRR